MIKVGLVCTAALLMAAGAQAQNFDVAAPPPPPPDGKPGVVFYRTIGPMDGLGGDLKTIPNAPYQAQSETATVQHLADGNVIQNSHTSKIARDNQGRTWTEQTIDKIGPWSTDEGPHTMVFISDPVAGYSYVLHPEKKTAERISLKHGKSDVMRHSRTVIVSKEGPGPDSGGVTSAISGPAAGSVGFSAAPGSAGPDKLFRLGPHEPGDEKSEDLGVQQINGVAAKGKRVTHTIPANTFGNQLPIITVTETWYSPDLQMVVESKRDDPRFGETTFNLKNIQKGEPPADLFQVPSDYTVTDGPPFPLPPTPPIPPRP